MKYLFVVSIIVLTIFSCRKKWTAFELKRQDYSGNQLRTDGYYYRVAEGDKPTRLFCFFRNGVLLNMGGTLENDIAGTDTCKKRIFA